MGQNYYVNAVFQVTDRFSGPVRSLSRQLGNLDRRYTDIGNSLSGIARYGIVAAGAVGTFTAAVRVGHSVLAGYNSEIEQMRINMAATLTALRGGGGVDVFNEKLTQSREIFEALRYDAIKSVGTTRDLMTIFQQVASPLAKTGYDVEKIRGVVRNAAVFSGVTGQSFELTGSDIFRMMMGVARRQMRSWRYFQGLGIVPADTGKFNRMSMDQRVAMVIKGLEMFQSAGGAVENSMKGILSTLQDMKDIYGSYMREPMYESVRRALQDAKDFLVTPAFMKDATKVTQHIGKIIGTKMDVMVASIRKFRPEHFYKLLSTIAVATEGSAKILYAALYAKVVGGVIRSGLSFGAGVGHSIYNMFSSTGGFLTGLALIGGGILKWGLFIRGINKVMGMDKHTMLSSLALTIGNVAKAFLNLGDVLHMWTVFFGAQVRMFLANHPIANKAYEAMTSGSDDFTSMLKILADPEKTQTLLSRWMIDSVSYDKIYRKHLNALTQSYIARHPGELYFAPTLDTARKSMPLDELQKIENMATLFATDEARKLSKISGSAFMNIAPLSDDIRTNLQDFITEALRAPDKASKLSDKIETLIENLNAEMNFNGPIIMNQEFPEQRADDVALIIRRDLANQAFNSVGSIYGFNISPVKGGR